MYLNGLNRMNALRSLSDGFENDFPVEPAGDWTLYPPQASDGGATSGTNWTNVLNTALNTWGTITKVNAEKKIAEARYASPYGAYNLQPGSTIPGQTFPYPSSAYTGATGYLPFPSAMGSGTIMGIPTTYVLLGAAAIAALLILKP